MSLKQLAERLGVEIKDLEFEFSGKCRDCRKVGGTKPRCDEECTVLASVWVKE